MTKKKWRLHTIGKEYEKLLGMVPYMIKIQAANVVARMPILPFLKQEMKMENKQDSAMDKTMEPVPSTSCEQSVISKGAKTIQTPSEVIEEETAKREDDEPEAEVTDEYF